MNEPAPFFHVRATFAWKPNRYYRVYIKPDELLFLHAGPGNGDAIALQTAVQGGAIGGLIGGLIAQSMRKRTKARKEALDAATECELLEFIASEKHSFRLATSEVSNACIDARSFWHSVMYQNPNCVALLRMQHPERGTMTLELLSADEARLVLDKLPTLLRDGLTVNTVWSESKKCYVR